MFKERGVVIPKPIAGLMVSAIISDTLLLKSPTCTQEDVEAVRELADIAGVNYEEYGLQMLKAGADLSKTTAEQLVSLDAKEFSMGTYKVVIAQVNAVDVSDVLSRQSEVESMIQKVIDNKQLDLFVFAVTDILNNDSVAIALGRAAKAVEKAYNVTLIDNKVTLKGVVSRKKQVVPVLTDVLTTFTL